MLSTLWWTKIALIEIVHGKIQMIFRYIFFDLRTRYITVTANGIFGRLFMNIPDVIGSEPRTISRNNL